MKIILLFCFFLAMTLTGCEEKKQPKGSQTPSVTESPTPASEAPLETPSPVPKEPQILSEYETKIFDKVESRTKNLNLCAKALNGYVINPGGEFSFNQTVGPRTPERGYEKAITYDENGEKKKDYGGGICQISSTLHMAAKKAGLTITERHDHKRDVPYESLGNDAAVCYGSQDLKFLNNQDSPIQIQVSINGQESVIVKLYKI